ncbi:MAG: hypothetical protein ACREQJ_03590 [Candidatus Binatia bacterium]
MPVERVSGTELPTFRREAILWTVGYRRKVIHLPAIKGLEYLSRLVATPGIRVRASELAGRSPGPADARAAERDRVNVTKGIKEAVKKIALQHPELGIHLEQGVRTGAFCRYVPVLPIGLTVPADSSEPESDDRTSR